MWKFFNKLLGVSSKVGVIIILLSLAFWPLSLLLTNTFSDFIKYLIPVLLLGLSFALFRGTSKFYLAPLLLVPFIEPKLAALPLLVALTTFVWQRERRYFLLIGLSVFVLLLNWKGFWGQTIFVPDYEKQQEVIGKTYLYPSVLLARTFQNKVRIYADKFTNNFFALSDPNNYFFGFHPREIMIDNQNLKKFPFLSLVFVLFGFYYHVSDKLVYLRNNPHYKSILIFLVSTLLSLSILSIFDRNDFVLWLPLSLILIHGIRVFEEKKWKFRGIFYAIFLVFTIAELIRIFLQ